MPTPETPEHHSETYTYLLDLETLDHSVAHFVYLDAPPPEQDDTALDFNRPSWEALGRPGRLRITITVEPDQ